MLYTVKQVAELTGITVKTLHHYDKVGILKPCQWTDAGYRLYGERELERLQQILFYRELDFSLKDIKGALENEKSRVQCLEKQRKSLYERKQRLDCILGTLENSLRSSRKGEDMNKSEMFTGLNEKEWRETLKEQNAYLKKTYDYDMLETEEIEVEILNQMSGESEEFMTGLAQALRDGWHPTDKRVQTILKKHIAFLSQQGFGTTAQSFALEEIPFFIEDCFHRDMLESQQTGLSYYLYTVANMYAQQEKKGE